MIKKKMKNVYEQNFEKMSGQEIRKELIKLFDPIRSITFYLASYFYHQERKSLWTDNINLNVRLYIDDEAIKCRENLEKISNFLTILTDYRY